MNSEKTNKLMMKFFIILNYYIILCHGRGTPSGLYNDDGKGHTILTQKFTKTDVREISYDILNIMGFHQRPRPHLVDNTSPGSQFLLEVYNSIAIGEVGQGDSLRNPGHVGEGTGDNFKSSSTGGLNLTWSQFNVDQKEVDAIKQADAIISFHNRGHRFSDRFKNYEEEKQFWFDVSEISDTDQVLGAELRLWKRTMVNSKFPSHGNAKDDENPYSGEVLRIAVKQIAPGDDEGTFSEIELEEIVTAKWEQGWIRLNVTSAFRKWITHSSLNYGLVLSTKRADNGEQVPMSATGLATIMDKEEHQPFLVAFLKTSDTPKKPPRTGRRVIRSVNGENRKGKKSKKQGRQYDFTEATDRPRSCQMGMLYVNFEDLGWKDWVIAPDGFIAYYCHGECSFPLTASMNATNHAIVSTLVHTYYPLEYPRPSCAPVKLGSISMLYYDDNSNVTVKKYKDMVIKSCGCK